MSRKGICYDNAPIESFWGTLKNELVYHCSYFSVLVVVLLMVMQKTAYSLWLS